MTRLSIKEKAGIIDTSRIFEGMHLSEGFLKNMADAQKKEKLEREIIVEGNRHLALCDKCSRILKDFEEEPKEGNLPL